MGKTPLIPYEMNIFNKKLFTISIFGLEVLLFCKNRLLWAFVGLFLLSLDKMQACFEDSNNISIGIHFFKVLVQIHYSRSPGSPGSILG